MPQKRSVLCLTGALCLCLILSVSALSRWDARLNRPPHLYDDELPLYGAVAQGEPATESKAVVKQLAWVSKAHGNPVRLDETRWYADLMKQPGPDVTMNPEDLLILETYLNSEEGLQYELDSIREKTVEITYTSPGMFALCTEDKPAGPPDIAILDRGMVVSFARGTAALDKVALEERIEAIAASDTPDYILAVSDDMNPEQLPEDYQDRLRAMKDQNAGREYVAEGRSCYFLPEECARSLYL